MVARKRFIVTLHVHCLSCYCKVLDSNVILIIFENQKLSKPEFGFAPDRRHLASYLARSRCEGRRAGRREAAAEVRNSVERSPSYEANSRLISSTNILPFMETEEL